MSLGGIVHECVGWCWTPDDRSTFLLLKIHDASRLITNTVHWVMGVNLYCRELCRA